VATIAMQKAMELKMMRTMMRKTKMVNPNVMKMVSCMARQSISHGLSDSDEEAQSGKRKRRSISTKPGKGKAKRVKRTDNRARVHQYDAETQKVIALATEELIAKILTSNPMANDKQVATEAASAWDRVCETLDLGIHIDEGLISVVSASPPNLALILTLSHLLVSWELAWDPREVASKATFATLFQLSITSNRPRPAGRTTRNSRRSYL
jgi:hypothetical protein